MARIRVRRQMRWNARIHNDLASAAHHFRKTIERRLAAGDRDGIAYDAMACATMLVFAFEAQINFLGAELVPDWKERAPFRTKLDALVERLGIPFDYDKRPFSTILRSKELRDQIAHGKPAILSLDEVVEGEASQVTAFPGLSSDWQAFCDPEKVFACYDDLDEVWNLLFSASGVDYFDTVSHGDHSLTFIEQVVDEQVRNEEVSTPAA